MSCLYHCARCVRGYFYTFALGNVLLFRICWRIKYDVWFLIDREKKTLFRFLVNNITEFKKRRRQRQRQHQKRCPDWLNREKIIVLHGRHAFKFISLTYSLPNNSVCNFQIWCFDNNACSLQAILISFYAFTWKLIVPMKWKHTLEKSQNAEPTVKFLKRCFYCCSRRSFLKPLLYRKL